MARPLRIEYLGAWYHLMNRGRRHEKIFHKEIDYRLFLEVLGYPIPLDTPHKPL
jgi:hypothetical protein